MIKFEPHDYIEPKDIIPLHEIRDKEKLKNIINDMKINGWNGRPILTYFNGEIDFALTGTHRINAARILNIEIPVVRINEDLAEDWFMENDYSIDDLTSGDDDDKLDKLKEIGDEVAIQLMKLELDKNINLLS